MTTLNFFLITFLIIGNICFAEWSMNISAAACPRQNGRIHNNRSLP